MFFILRLVLLISVFSQKNQRFSRAYIDFEKPEDVVEFAEFFDGHVFVNEKGNLVSPASFVSWQIIWFVFSFLLEENENIFFCHLLNSLFIPSGTQFKALVEYAPSQRVPKLSKKDGREGTIFKGIISLFDLPFSGAYRNFSGSVVYLLRLS